MSKGFAFRQFRVHDDRCQMKVGTDGVLLGAWANVSGSRRVLDAGCGSGLIALMVAQRESGAQIDGVEILQEDALQAKENIEASDWCDRIIIRHVALQDFKSPDLYDVILSNPPYFNKSLLPPQEGRASVRHTTTLTHEELLTAVARLLQADGRFCVILPFTSQEQFTALAKLSNLHLRRLLAFSSRPGKQVERYLMEFSFQPGPLVQEEITLYANDFDGTGRDHWSSDYRQLVGDFYL
jgi:tRNA1Val (adenine37-N6)-methyltransferase